MTTGKRALIVDDSRSARIILSRMLEQNGLVVDTAESAEQALDYLQRSRPDVIFMDHLMPGMDGFQAVQVIKSDPLTATIPLMMYTSQEGELYVSQARALGAVGVLPKTVRPVDVSRILYQLHLLPDRRTRRNALFDGPAAAAAAVAEVAPEDAAMAAALAATGTQAALPLGEAGADAGSNATVPAMSPFTPSPAALHQSATPTAAMALSAAAVAELQAGLRQSTQQLVKDQLGEQRRFMLATFEAFARRLTTEVRESVARSPVVAPEAPPPPPRRQWWPVVLTALLAAAPAGVLGYLAWEGMAANQTLAQDLAAAKADAEKARAEALSAAAAATLAGNLPAVPGTPPADAKGGPPSGPIATEYVQYGETPLGGSRLDRLRSISATLEAQGFKGRIRVESFVGDFCLTGNAGEGFAVADAGLAAQKCDLVGNPFDDSLSAAQRQSVDFANFVAMLRKRTGGAIDVEIVNGGRRQPREYPAQGERTTAGEWNVVAAQNNRVEFHVIPGA